MSDRREEPHDTFSNFREYAQDEGWVVPVKYAVCETCEGRGTHVNPSIDAHGIGAEEWANDWDDEEREAYHSGRYDVSCAECKGVRVVEVLDEERAESEVIAAWNQWQRDSWSSYAESEAERRMGA